jgi:glycosyltransferase involved in cell wall biosynthesis
MLGVIIARLLGKKCIVKTALTGSWGDFATLKGFDGYDEAFTIIKQADAFVCVSHALERELPEIGIDARKVVYIPNGLDTEQFKSPGPRCIGAPVVFLQSCRMHPQKALDVTLRAAQLLKQRGYARRFRIEFCGQRYPEYDYPELAHELDVDDVTHFGEYTRNIYPLYVAADVFLLPSRAEGLSNSLLEAMSMEMPVIATKISGSEDVLTHGVDGVLIEAECAEALAEAMQQYMDQPEWALQLGREARRTVQNRFSIAYVAEQYGRLYERLCGGTET